MARPPYTTRTQAYVRARANAAMLATVRILRMTKPTMNDTTLVMTSASSETVYSGSARVKSTSPGAIVVGEGVQATDACAVSIPFDAPLPRVDDVVLIDTFGTDTELVSRAFRVTGVDGGGLVRATRTLSCVAYAESRWWES